MNEVQQFCRDHHPCEEGARFALRHKTLAAVWANCERGDWLWWMLRENGLVTKKLSVSVAIALAEHVLDIYESRPRSDDRPRNAIWTAREYLRSPSARTKELARAAAMLAAAVAAAYAYAAADAYAAVAAERKWQADKIRELVGSNPFV